MEDAAAFAVAVVREFVEGLPFTEDDPVHGSQIYRAQVRAAVAALEKS